MDSDEEDFVFVGTPIEREEENISRKKKANAEASGQLRTLVPWKQEVRDEEGRRRFHGAFTGGYSAGYYNTVGSKEGWAPQSFTSSRKNRAEVKQQNILNFLDDDEKAEMEGNLLGTSSQFDTFGFTAAEHARKKAEKEQKQRPAAIPGPVPDELVLPSTDSIGVKLLLKMGWRRGRSIKDSNSNSLHDVRREGRKAFLALSSDDIAVQGDSSEVIKNDFDAVTEHSVNEAIKSSEPTPVYVRKPKQDMHGLGYDPYKNAPEFREKKNSGMSGSRGVGNKKPFSVRDDLLLSRSGRLAPGFGIGALEELDVEDEDVYTSEYNFEETYVQEVEDPSTLAIENKELSIQKVQGGFPRFKLASNSDYQLERFKPPVVPDGFVPYHKFLAPLDNSQVLCSPPPEVPPPEDNNLKVTIDGVASLVARCGKLFEDLSREKNQSNPLFSFLFGGGGSEYYARKLWEEQQKRCGQPKLLLDEKLSSGKQKMTAEDRGRVLGEKPLKKVHIELSSPAVTLADNSQFNLSNTFTSPKSLNQLLETAQPFKDDPAKQNRFEQFIKDKYQGGLRSTDSSGASNMSESARARERLDFEVAAEAIQKSKQVDKGKLSAQLMDFTSSRLQFTSGGVEEKSSQAEELAAIKLYPKREEFQWRPAPLLCKRFDIMDPCIGKPPAAPTIRSKMDSLIFTPDFVKSTKVEDVGVNGQSSSSPFDSNLRSVEINNAENDVAVEAENVERPVDLYKAIFSDDSDTEEETSNLNQVDQPQKKVEAATATFSRLVAGDFLESLGKELGMELPPDLPLPTSKTKLPAPHTPDVLHSENSSAIKEEGKCNEGSIPNSSSSILKASEVVSLSRHTDEVKHDRKDRSSSGRRYDDSERSSSEDERSKKKSRRQHSRFTSPDRKARSSSGRHNYDSDSSSSADERSKKRSRRSHRRSSSPDKRKRSQLKSHKREHSSSHKRSQEDSIGSHRSRDRDRSERKEKHRKRE